ncbi:MAG: hypothetical protein CBB92_12975 [Flammeovirgaceae bacterium TMED32]|nr:MAG: hypothetical protein CBB92_12975 [Flammeovirgaceae bacterium TMED32]
MRIFKYLLTLAIVLFCLKGNSQHVASTYAIYGIGELNNNGLAHNQAMGGLGTGMPNRFNINLQNPAWLTYNQLSSFNAGLQGESRTYKSELENGSKKTGSIKHMVFFIPLLNGKWGSAFSLLPFSTAEYEVGGGSKVTDATPNESTDNTFIGSGGLSQFAWSNGFRIFNSTNIGFNLMYVFGAIDKQNQSSLASDSSSIGYYTQLSSNETYKSFLFSVALAHKMKINETHEMNFGITYQHSGQLNGLKDVFLSRYLESSLVQVGSPIPISNEENTSFDLPKKFNFGLSYGLVDKYRIGLDINLANWISKGTNNPLIQNTQEFIIGGEMTPDNRNITNYLKRVTYRFGFNYAKLPYLVQNNSITEFGINFGASFPVAGLSTLDVAIKLGERGTIENGLVNESFMQMVLGLTINEKWFVKRKYN